MAESSDGEFKAMAELYCRLAYASADAASLGLKVAPMLIKMAALELLDRMSALEAASSNPAAHAAGSKRSPLLQTGER